MRVQARELGVADGRPLTVTGGMTFAGGPLNNYVLQAMVTLARVLRDDPGSLGLSTSVSGMITKQGLGLWSTEPPANGFTAVDVSDEVAAGDARHCRPRPMRRATARSSGYTVVFDGDRPAQAIVVATVGDVRTVTTSDDPDVAAALTEGEWVGRTVTVGADGGFTTHALEVAVEPPGELRPLRREPVPAARARSVVVERRVRRPARVRPTDDRAQGPRQSLRQRPHPLRPEPHVQVRLPVGRRRHGSRHRRRCARTPRQHRFRFALQVLEQLHVQRGSRVHLAHLPEMAEVAAAVEVDRAALGHHFGERSVLPTVAPPLPVVGVRAGDRLAEHDDEPRVGEELVHPLQPVLEVEVHRARLPDRALALPTGEVGAVPVDRLGGQGLGEEARLLRRCDEHVGVRAEGAPQ